MDIKQLGRALVITLGISLSLTCGARAATVTPTTAITSTTSTFSDIEDPSEFPCAPKTNPWTAPGGKISLAFCAQWDPEFAFRGGVCCRKPPAPKRRRANRCDPSRTRADYCGDRTEVQVDYEKRVREGTIPDALAFIESEMPLHETQAFCDVNRGFLAWGRPLVETDANRIALKSPQRCTNFATDRMAAVLEWAGREVKREYADPSYAGVRLVIGDVSAPRGGCLAGRGGRRGHSSHTSGQDADVGFLTVHEGSASPMIFHQKFDAARNWWLLKRLFGNPYACVRRVFLDRRLIGQLGKKFSSDPEWERLRPFIQHLPGHKNHLHVRIEDHPGQPGCRPPSEDGFDPADEEEGEEEGAGDGGEELGVLEGLGADRAPAAQARAPR